MAEIEEGAVRLAAIAARGGRILFFGNGGSAAMALHLAAELSVDTVALADPASLTAIGNDLSFDEVFAVRVRALARPGDAVVTLSTSGKSENVLQGVRAARLAGATTFALTGARPNPLAELADHTICIPSRSTARIQELHLFCGHVICEMIEAACH